MFPNIQKVKGIHPGVILNKFLHDEGIEKKKLAQTISEFPQTLSAICKLKRGISPLLSIKLGRFFNIDESYFTLLQAEYEIAIERNKLNKMSAPKFRKILFWDTDFDKIDWEKNKKSVIKRVFERGNEVELVELDNFYGKSIVNSVVKNLTPFNS